MRGKEFPKLSVCGFVSVAHSAKFEAQFNAALHPAIFHRRSTRRDGVDLLSPKNHLRGAIRFTIPRTETTFAQTPRRSVRLRVATTDFLMTNAFMGFRVHLNVDSLERKRYEERTLTYQAHETEGRNSLLSFALKGNPNRCCGRSLSIRRRTCLGRFARL